jgi:hypothetical protein
MIRHIVLLDLVAGHDATELAAVMDGLDRLRGQIAGFSGFSHGPNRDFEGKSPDCAYAFTCDFDSPATARAYLADPDHRALGARLVAICKGGADGITVIDLEVAA